MTRTKVKKDEIGLYVFADGWVCRPAYGTSFKEGDSIKSKHFGGSTEAGVTYLDGNFKQVCIILDETADYEMWTTTGIGSNEYKNVDMKKMKKDYEWYKEHGQPLPKEFIINHNKRFAKKFKGKSNI